MASRKQAQHDRLQTRLVDHWRVHVCVHAGCMGLVFKRNTNGEGPSNNGQLLSNLTESRLNAEVVWALSWVGGGSGPG
eukprot:6927299-Alexandrium_andersonii.AAC.1